MKLMICIRENNPWFSAFLYKYWSFILIDSTTPCNVFTINLS